MAQNMRMDEVAKAIEEAVNNYIDEEQEKIIGKAVTAFEKSIRDVVAKAAVKIGSNIIFEQDAHVLRIEVRLQTEG